MVVLASSLHYPPHHMDLLQDILLVVEDPVEELLVIQDPAALEAVVRVDLGLISQQERQILEEAVANHYKMVVLEL
tara:strand:+ start:332 stop:559 length:228 start_codon:yes stop_codon:yes gene_type:complete